MSANNDIPRSQSYQPVPRTSSPGLPQSPTDPYANLSGQALSPNAYLTPEQETSGLLGGNRQSATYPAPSLISRDSTHLDSPHLGQRDSWNSSTGLAAGAAAGGLAGTQTPIGRSGLGAEPVNRFSIDDGQGHVAPAGMSEEPRWSEKGAAEGGRSRKKLWIGLGAAVIVAAALAIGLGVGLTRNNSNSSNAGTGSSGAGAGGSSASGGSGGSPSGTASGSAPSSSPSPSAPVTGTRGSTVTFEDGTTMTYDNPYGGHWVHDPSNPFNNTARAQSYTPPLNAEWRWGRDRVWGVNVGGWLVTEPFIVPGLYERTASGPAGTSVDEYTLTTNMGSNRDRLMTEHYDTFITERDFVEMVSAGINWVRLPFGFWALETLPGEPYYPLKSWEYVLKAIGWARKYGIRINLDMHAHPGSQNGWNHSGKIGSVNWMKGLMGLANAQRSLEYVRSVTQFISQPEYAPVIQLWGFINEPNAQPFGAGKQSVGSYYNRVYQETRAITGLGAGNGPMLSVHDGFIGLQEWYDFLPGADRLGLDQHPYLCFGDQQTGPVESLALTACQIWASSTNSTLQQFGTVVAGEWSVAVNDCGQWLNAVGAGTRWEGTYDGYTGPTGGSCATWNDYRLWDQSRRTALRNFVKAEMDAFQDFFFWTWRIGNSTSSIPEPNAMWHYRLGLREGWIPTDPRESIGECVRLGVAPNPFSGTFSSPHMTGGPGAGSIAASDSASYPWPPSSFNNVGAGQMTLLPQFTQTGTPLTVPAPTFTQTGSDASATIDAGDGWFNPSNSRRRYVPVSGCTYPPEYSAVDLQPTAGACGAGARPVTARAAMPTPPPAL